MRKKHIVKTISLTLAFIGMGTFAQLNAQDVQLSHLRSTTRINLDLNKVWNYNIYEHSRWGVGLNVSMPFPADSAKNYFEQRKLYAEAYGGYGTRDHGWKYGAKAQVQRPRSYFDNVELGYRHDLERAGGHSFNTYDIFGTMNNSGYFSDRYSAIDRIHFGFGHSGRRNGFFVEGRLSQERHLFDNNALLYPLREDADKDNPAYAEAYRIAELHVCDVWKKDLTVDITLGNARLKGGSQPFVRLVGQYAHTYKLDGDAKTEVYLQGGYASSTAPLSRQFDLGGTAFGLYFFNHTFLTVRPNTFMANTFVHACATYRSPALYKTRISYPCVIAQLNAMWGTQTTGMRFLQQTVVDGVGISAPTQSVLEPTLGLDKVIKWGILDIGVAAAYQITPASAPYHLTEPKDCLAIVGIATLVFEN